MHLFPFFASCLSFFSKNTQINIHCTEPGVFLKTDNFYPLYIQQQHFLGKGKKKKNKQTPPKEGALNLPQKVVNAIE